MSKKEFKSFIIQFHEMAEIYGLGSWNITTHRQILTPPWTIRNFNIDLTLHNIKRQTDYQHNNTQNVLKHI